ncbi:MAG: isoleucine--tRNA ligase [Rhabdochlamydiaceae bacterium]
MFEQDHEYSFSKKEEEILAFWKKNDVFQKSLKKTENQPIFSFYDGPPFATGLPHYGHLLAGTLKDVIPRYKTMKGFYVSRRFGWDCHGLPVENEIEKNKQLSGADAIERFGIAEFNEECRSIVLRYTDAWKSTVERMGRWVDFMNTYKTMDSSFMESVWWVFGELYKKSLIYEGFKVMPFSAKLGTPLSNFEANLNYKDVDDPSLTVKFSLTEEKNTYFLVWTTTPWTLPSNLALAVSPSVDYVKIQVFESNDIYILGKNRLSTYFKEESTYKILETFKGTALKGKTYQPLFDYFFKSSKKGFYVLVDDFVGEEDGTGIVHLAPAFGEADYAACLKEGIDPVCPIDQNGKFTSQIPDYVGLFVKDADKEIIKKLKQESKIFLHTQIRHRYPFCWRSDTPLIYKMVNTWFVKVESFKDQLLTANQKISWVPEHIKEGRFGKWLENARDWAISRNRYWGTPIPIWRGDRGDLIVVSSIKELEEKTKTKISDLHRHFIDDLTFEINGQKFKRVSEVFDCWFESGSMPYAQNHFPFGNEDLTLKNFPADYIAEGLDQTRGWFYTLTVLSVALFDSPAFKNVVVNGIILAEDGQKMSKRLKNYPEPEVVINKYGADAVRLYLLNSPVVYGEDLKFSEKGVEMGLRQLFIPLSNVYHFLATYAKLYQWEPSQTVSFSLRTSLDQWLVSLTHKLILDVTKSLDKYAFNEAVSALIDFTDQLTNWYIRRSRKRFWSDVASDDRREAFESLYYALYTFCLVSAPIIPFISEHIYLKIRKHEDPESIHLCDYPVYEERFRLEKLEKEMQVVQEIVSLGHSLRKENKIKVRQPLLKAFIVHPDEAVLKLLSNQIHLISDELNVKEVILGKKEEMFVTLQAKPNFRVLGKKFGPMMAQIQQLIQQLSQLELSQLLQKGELVLQLNKDTFCLSYEDVEIIRKVKDGVVAINQGSFTLVLDLTINDDLIYEGLARELVNKLNTIRKEKKLEITDRIKVYITSSAKVQEAISQFEDYIKSESLCVEILNQENQAGEAWDLNGQQALIYIEKCNVTSL